MVLFVGAVHAHFLMGTPAYNSPRENVYAMYMMEKISYDDAIAKGFKMSVAQNTSPITQVRLSVLFDSRLLKYCQSCDRWLGRDHEQLYSA